MNKKQKLVYIGHDYHTKTLSTKFLIEMFKEKFEVDIFTYDMKHQKFFGSKETNLEEYEVLVLFQMPIPVEELKKKFNFKKGSYFPMYDGTGEAEDEFWIGYKDFNIINFSSTLHKRLLKMKFSTYYIQYFPKPLNFSNWGKNNSIFFWNRRSLININYLKNILEDFKVKNIHMHIAMDPNEKYIEEENFIKENYSITKSDWFDTREEMQKVIESSSLYIAPRIAEGIGMSFLEAMSMGRCVIALNNPTMNEYITNGFNGFLYEYSNPKIFLDNDILEIQKNAYEYIKKGYENWEKEKRIILDWVLNEPIKNVIEISNKKKYYKILNFNMIVKRADGTFWFFDKIKINKKIIEVYRNYKKNKR